MALPLTLHAPLLECDFELSIQGVQIGYFAECTGMAVEYEVLEHREGGNNDFVHMLRGRRKHTNITLKRGVTKEDALLRWFNDVSTSSAHDMTISMVDEQGTMIRTFTFAAAVPIRWTGPNATAQSSSVCSESLEIAHQGLVT